MQVGSKQLCSRYDREREGGGGPVESLYMYSGMKYMVYITLVLTDADFSQVLILDHLLHL